VWKERDSTNWSCRRLINQALSPGEKDKLFADRFAYTLEHFDTLEQNGGREVTEQDRAVFALCRPERLLELTFRFIIFEAGEKKIARYQQYFCVRKILERIRHKDEDGRRKGGVVWHTQGSGKSLTMVMLGKALALEPGLGDFKIILVTDRVDLDDQIYGTFLHCGTEPVQAKTGIDLAKLIEGHKQRIITTVIDKFEAALSRKDLCNGRPRHLRAGGRKPPRPVRAAARQDA